MDRYGDAESEGLAYCFEPSLPPASRRSPRFLGGVLIGNLWNLVHSWSFMPLMLLLSLRDDCCRRFCKKRKKNPVLFILRTAIPGDPRKLVSGNCKKFRFRGRRICSLFRGSLDFPSFLPILMRFESLDIEERRCFRKYFRSLRYAAAFRGDDEVAECASFPILRGYTGRQSRFCAEVLKKYEMLFGHNLWIARAGVKLKFVGRLNRRLGGT
ncbi:hypothetical protein Droror1_Dr00006447 [Drosera rotundifolia]